MCGKWRYGAAAIFVGLAFLAQAEQARPSATVYAAGDNGFACYRIPAIVATQAGTLLAFAEARRGGCSDTGEIATVLRRSEDGGATWGAMQEVAGDGANTWGNPAPVVDRATGRIWLGLTFNAGDAQEGAINRGEAPPRSVWMTSSDNDGRTWDKPREISAATRLPEWRWYATGPGHGIQLRDGVLLIACDHSTGADTALWRSHVILSRDHGQTWALGSVVDPKTNECTVAQLPDGSLYLNARTYHGDKRRRIARSADGGLTWSPAEKDEALVEPVCQAAVLYSETSGALVFSNPASERRENMTLKVSRDGGATWPHQVAIHGGPSAYSDLVELPRGGVGLLYECGEATPYERIVFTSVDLPAAEQGKG